MVRVAGPDIVLPAIDRQDPAGSILDTSLGLRQECWTIYTQTQTRSRYQTCGFGSASTGTPIQAGLAVPPEMLVTVL